jgi:thiol-disulfide isomerase/thioredoxin
VIAAGPVLPSAPMTCAARLASAASLLAVLACQPEPTTPPEPAPAPGEPWLGGDSATETETAAPAGPAEPSAAELGDAEPGDAELDDGGEADPITTVAAVNAASGSSDEQPSADPAAKAPLPKPIHKPSDGSCIKKFAVGEQVKGFRLPSLAGDKSISPAGYRNRVVLLNFWATWCKPCLAELPEFDRLYRKYRKHGMTLVAVTTDEDPKAVQAFADQHKLAAKIALSGEKAAGEYARPNFPFSFVVDGHGTIVAAFDYVDDACLGDLEQVIRESLEQLDG